MLPLCSAIPLEIGNFSKRSSLLFSDRDFFGQRDGVADAASAVGVDQRRQHRRQLHLHSHRRPGTALLALGADLIKISQ